MSEEEQLTEEREEAEAAERAYQAAAATGDLERAREARRRSDVKAKELSAAKAQQERLMTNPDYQLVKERLRYAEQVIQNNERARPTSHYERERREETLKTYREVKKSAEELLEKVERGEFSPTTSYADAKRFYRMLYPGKKSSWYSRKASGTARGDPRARIVRKDVLEEARRDYEIRQETGLSQEEYESLSGEEKKFLVEAYEKGLLKEEGEKKVYTIQDEGGKVWRSSSPEFLKEKTGIDVEKVRPGTVVLREEGTGKVFYARKERLGGKEYLVGVGEPTTTKTTIKTTTKNVFAPREKPPEQPAPQEPGWLLKESIKTLTKKPPEEKAFIYEPAKIQLVTGEKISFAPSYVETKFFRENGESKGVVSPAPEIPKSRKLYFEAERARARGEPVKEFLGLSGAAFGGGYEMVSSIFKEAIPTKKRPLAPFETAGMVIWGLPLMAINYKETIQHVKSNPPAALGEFFTGFLLGKAGVKVARIARDYQISEVKTYEGALITKDTAGKIVELTKDVGTDIKVRPLLYEEKYLVGKEKAGAGALIRGRAPVYGEPFFISSEELSKAPENYLFRSVEETSVVHRPASTRPPQLTPAKEGAVGVTKVSKKWGVVSGEEIKARATPFLEFAYGKTELRPDIVREYKGYGTTEYTPIELAKERSLVSKEKAKGAGRKPPEEFEENLIEYRPSVDYWGEELVAVAPEETVRVTKSLATREERVEVFKHPLEIIKIEPRKSKTFPFIKPPGETLSKKKTPSQGVIIKEETKDLPTEGGTVLQQKVIVIEEEEAKPVAETITKQEEVILEKMKSQELKEEKQKTGEETITKKKYKVVSVQESALREGFAGKVGEKAVTKTKQIAPHRFQQLTILLSRTAASSMVGSAVKLKQQQEQLQKQHQDQLRKQQEKTKTDTITLTELLLRTTTKEKTRGEQLTSELARFWESRPPAKPVSPREKPPELPPSIRLGKSEKPLFGSRFVAEIKRRGRFRRIGVFKSPEEAFKEAAKTVDTTAAASFRVKSDKEEILSKLPSFLKNKFRMSKITPGLIVEKTKYRISTPGEKSEIRPKKGLFGGLGKSPFKK